MRNLNYKTIRFTGHAEQMRFLLNDLRFIEHRDELKAVLERAVPGTDDDQVVIFVSATGQRGGRFMDRTWARTVLSREIGGRHWTAIQVTTAAGAPVASLPLVVQEPVELAGVLGRAWDSLRLWIK